MLISGDIEKLSSHFGTYIQIRPKAANRDTRCQGIGVDGRRIETIPRGFYFRAKFTQQILKDESPLNHYFCDINGVNLLCRKPFS
jgi:DNA mismatch repair protein MutH